MTFVSHLKFLISGSSVEHTVNDKQTLQEWNSHQGLQEAKPVEKYEDDIESPVTSLLDLYYNHTPDHPSSSQHNPLIQTLLSKPNAQHLLSPLRTILASSHPNDVISGELVELLGFGDIELVMEILNKRMEVFHALSQLDSLDFRDTSSPQMDKEKGRAVASNTGLRPEDARWRMEEQIRANASRPLFSASARDAPEVLPHVYTSHSVTSGGVLSELGKKYMLPLGTIRQEHEDYEEVIVPPANPPRPRDTERLIAVSELDPIAQGSFSAYRTLNRIQSIVYPTAFGSNENMLVCAPTGAGKTDVAMLAILRVLDQNRSTRPAHIAKSIAATINRDSFKIIYVAPMKALAAEIVRKLGKRLQWLDIRVRELTGDMQMTKSEIAETQIIVTTPEKWDVVTRKPTGEGELASKVRLLIIDEVHLLDEERGAVIETIVARTLRQVESSQSVIRIVGLSATLPNYQDVAEFLSVSRYAGLFYFDSSFRPIPLQQHFIGVKGKEGSPQARRNLDRVTFEKVSELVREGHQIMVFVHARKETVKTAQALKEAALLDGILEEFSCEEHQSWSLFRRDISESRNKEMRQLFDFGFGIHHAGMLRSDRNMMERMFEARAIKVLCCTATLAWGVNLPAHAVILKGTQVYDSHKGSFTDLSVLDVLQVFGRAGRPGLETSGEGYICTSEDKLTHYLDAVTSQNPIESKFIAGMTDSLNAEIALGTVTTVPEAMKWLGYTYLFVRMRKNPVQYGLGRDEVAADPHLGNKRHRLITEAGIQLAKARMINFDERSERFTITDLGRIAARYYIRYATIDIFNLEFRPRMTDADVLAMLSRSTEFNQIQLRESEIKELDDVMKDLPCDVKGGTDTQYGKVNILLQSFISRYRLEDFALISDQAYVAQNGGRIIRALLEIALSRKWADASFVLMRMSKAVEKRMWPYEHPLKQFFLNPDVVYNLERWADDWAVEDLVAMTGEELGKLIHLNEKHGSALLNVAKQLPRIEINYALRPLGRDILKIVVHVHRSFTWNSKTHGSAEPFWLWIEDSDGSTIKQLFHLLFRPTTEVIDAEFVVSIPTGETPTSMTIRYVSDRWTAADSETLVSFDSLVMPAPAQSRTPRLDLPFLTPSALGNSALQASLPGLIEGFNAIQTQIFWSLMHTKMHSLVCAPVGCGKSVMVQISTLKTLHEAASNSAWALVIVSRHSIASEYIATLREYSKNFQYDIVSDQDVFKPMQNKCIRIVTVQNLLRALGRQNSPLLLKDLKLVVCENLELLDAKYELAVSVLRQHIQNRSVRFVGLCSSLNDPADLAAWLQVDPFALHNFRPSDRDQSLSITTQTFSIPLSSALLKAMAKPAHLAIQTNPGEPAMIFIPSSAYSRTVAMDLLTQCALEMETEKGYVPPGTSEEELKLRLARLQDKSLVDFVSRGVGFYHEGITKGDRGLILQMYVEGIVRVLIVSRTSCWTVPARAGIVIVMGTQYVQAASAEADRRIREYELEEIVRMQGRAVRPDQNGHFYLFCHAEAKDTFTRFLDDGFPLESCLHEAHALLRDWFQGNGENATKQNIVRTLSFTFLAHRLVTNPVYYDVTANESRDGILSHIADSLYYAITTDPV